jgi:hypothetical protein
MVITNTSSFDAPICREVRFSASLDKKVNIARRPLQFKGSQIPCGTQMLQHSTYFVMASWEWVNNTLILWRMWPCNNIKRKKGGHAFELH